MERKKHTFASCSSSTPVICTSTSSAAPTGISRHRNKSAPTTQRGSSAVDCRARGSNTGSSGDAATWGVGGGVIEGEPEIEVHLSRSWMSRKYSRNRRRSAMSPRRRDRFGLSWRLTSVERRDGGERRSDRSTAYLARLRALGREPSQ